MTPNTLNSRAWIFFCYASFAVAVGSTALGVWIMEIPPEMKAFMGMGLMFTVGSAFTLAKTLRDEHEAHQFHHRLNEARTERLLRDSDPLGDNV